MNKEKQINYDRYVKVKKEISTLSKICTNPEIDWVVKKAYIEDFLLQDSLVGCKSSNHTEKCIDCAFKETDGDGEDTCFLNWAAIGFTSILEVINSYIKEDKTLEEGFQKLMNKI
jgi:hypothetical protein